MALGGSHHGPGVSLAVELPLHKEVTLLFEVDVTVGAHEAAGVAEFVPGFHHRPTGTRGDREETRKTLKIPFFF